MRLTLSAGWVALLCLFMDACGQAQSSGAWPEWDEFAERFVQQDGRVVDITFEQKSISEGQGYGLFFALVSNDRPRFDAILKWTSDNLAGGQLGDKLPAWLWGRRDDGSWGIKDANPASDADLWIAYSLLEAARLWKEPRYAQTARRMLDQIRAQEVVTLDNDVAILLPAPFGFALEGGRYRIDPCYLPPFLLRYLATVDAQGPWKKIWDGFLRMAPAAFSKGVAPDLFIVDSKGVVSHDTERKPQGSYDAIRNYLWAGMSGRDGAKLLQWLSPYRRLIREHGAPPETADPVSGEALPADFKPLGFSGAVLPYLQAVGDRDGLEQQLSRLRWGRTMAKLTRGSNYYDEVLILFGKGWIESYYSFDVQGSVQPRWSAHEAPGSGRSPVADHGR